VLQNRLGFRTGWAIAASPGYFVLLVPISSTFKTRWVLAEDKRNCTGWRYINMPHRAIGDAVKATIREGIKDVHILDDARVSRICASITDEEGALKRPDLTYESFVQKKHKTLKIYNLTEITIP
jgi:hypothetical protein